MKNKTLKKIRKNRSVTDGVSVRWYLANKREKKIQKNPTNKRKKKKKQSENQEQNKAIKKKQ